MADAVGVEVGDTARVDAALDTGTAAEVAEAADRSVEPETFCVGVGREFVCAAAGLSFLAEWPVPEEASGAVARGVVGCVESGCGTNGALRVGPPSSVLISRAT
ncbi:hypothetical protein [Streptomyces gibsoniae]|uniref:Uncharacterized protein n=1 Tax=Streptomyces gibsoniae TaxID=3075529 RepID=A0ABU2UAW7_9ACTN|nr:hypothetical protein [Streptomyces sp. DSM 41699]MDT0470112.1 hypothetical protein [Streptomyces sp. DSM 41699]